MAAHGVGGTVGALLTGVFAEKGLNGLADGAALRQPGQLGIQAVAVAAAIVYSGVASFILLKLIGVFVPLRADVLTKPAAWTSPSMVRRRTSGPPKGRAGPAWRRPFCGDARPGRPERRAADKAFAARSGHRSRDSSLNTGEHWGEPARFMNRESRLVPFATKLPAPLAGKTLLRLRALTGIRLPPWPPMHPAGRRCSSLTYARYARSSRLAGRAPRRPSWQPYSRRALSVLKTGAGAPIPTPCRRPAQRFTCSRRPAPRVFAANGSSRLGVHE